MENISTNDNKSHHKIIEIGHIADFIKMLREQVSQNKKVLLVSDIDDTLIRPVVNFGSDSWYSYSLKNEESDHVINKLSMIYALLNFQGVEKDTKQLIATIKELSESKNHLNPIKYFCLTSRNVKFHSHTVMHLHRIGYDKTFIRRNMLNISDHMYLMNNDNVPIVRYVDNICFTSGENKGIVLVEILRRYFETHTSLNDKFDVIIFLDDSIKNISNVNEQLSKYSSTSFNSVCVHYTYMEEHKNKYSIHHFINDTNKMNKLIELRSYINDDDINSNL